MPDRGPLSRHEYVDILDALKQSARDLDADPTARPASAYRARGRAALLQSIQGVPTPGFFRFQLVGLSLAAILFLAVAAPAVASPGAVVESVSSAAHSAAQTVGQMIGRRGNGEVEAKASPAQSKQVQAATPTATMTVTPTPTVTPIASVMGTSQPVQHEVTAGTNHGLGDSVPRDNHGADVSEVARATPRPGENHGQEVRKEARDNHGQAVSATARAEAKPGDKHDEKHADKPPAEQADKQADKHADKHDEKHADKPPAEQADKHADKPEEEQTDKHENDEGGAPRGGREGQGQSQERGQDQDQSQGREKTQPGEGKGRDGKDQPAVQGVPKAITPTATATLIPASPTVAPDTQTVTSAPGKPAAPPSSKSGSQGEKGPRNGR